jgi:hypothetical protein
MEIEGFNFDSVFEAGTEQGAGTPLLDDTQEVSTQKKGKNKEIDVPDIKEGIEYSVGENSSMEDVDEESVKSKKKVTDEVEVDDEETDNIPSSDEIKSTKDASGSFALAFAKFQQEEGIISDFDEAELLKIAEEEGQTGALKYLLEKQRDSIYEEAKEMYGADKQELLEYFELKDAGVNPDIAKELAFQKGQFESITDSQLAEDEDLQKMVLIQHYKLTTRFSDAKIKEKVADIIALGKNEEEAKEALGELKELTKKQIEQAKVEAKSQEVARIQAAAKYKEDLKKYIYDTTEIIPGQKITKPTQQKLEKMILDPVKDNTGNVTNSIWAERNKDPRKFDLLLAYHLSTGLFYGKTDVLTRKEKTKAADELEKVLEGKGGVSKGKNTGSAVDAKDLSWFFNKK